MGCSNRSVGSKRLVLVAPGSRGDVQPFVALAGGLRQAGYLVRVAAHETFRALVEVQDVEFAALTGDPQALLLDPRTQRIVDSAGNPLRALRGVRAALRELGSTVIADAWQAARDADAVVHCGPLSLPAFYAAQALKVPSIGAAVQPLTATRAFPTVAAGGPRLPGQINLLSHLLAEQAFWGVFRPAISRWRREHGQNAASLLGPFRGWRGHGHQFVYGFSPNLLPKPPDWGPNDHVTGAWLVDSRAQARLSDELEAFLAAGPPPSERILLVGETAHDLLFARVLAVVHHGGAWQCLHRAGLAVAEPLRRVLRLARARRAARRRAVQLAHRGASDGRRLARGLQRASAALLAAHDRPRPLRAQVARRPRNGPADHPRRPRRGPQNTAERLDLGAAAPDRPRSHR